MQHQVGVTSGLSEDGRVGWNLGLSTSGSGSWTSIANQEATTSSSAPSVAKSDSASDAGDDASSVKSGSAMSNISNITTQQSQDSAMTPGALPNNSSSPWNASTNLPSMESGPWGSSNSPAPTSMGSFGWNTTPSSLSMSTNNQGISNNMQPGVGGSISFNSNIGNNSSSGWPSGISSNPLSTASVPPNPSSGLQSGTISSQWQGSSNMIGNIGDFPKSTSEPNWNNSPMIDSNVNKENNPDSRMWGMPSDKPQDGQWDPSKPQWGNLPIGAGGDQGVNNNAELSFAQAALKGIKPPPVKPPPVLSAKNEEILRAIENHDGWGSRAINQESNWDFDSSPKSHRKFSAENSPAQASNVWNNRNGTAIWDSVRDNSSWSGPAPAAGKPWNGDKDPNNWGGMPKPAQDNWGPGGVNAGGAGGADSKSFGMWGGPGAGGDAGNKMWGQKPEVRSWGMGDANNGRHGNNMSSWGDDNDTSGWEERRGQPGMSGPVTGMIPPNPSMGGPGMPGVAPQGMPGMGNMQGGMMQGGGNMHGGNMHGGNMQGGNMQGGNIQGGSMQGGSMQGGSMQGGNMQGGNMQGGNMQGGNMHGGMAPDNNATAWNDAQKSGWNSANAGGMTRPKMDEPWNKPPPRITGWGDPGQDQAKIDDGTSMWGPGNIKQMPPSQPKPGGWGETAPQGQWNAAVGTKPKMPTGWDEASYTMAQRAKLAPPKYMGNNSGYPTQMRAKLLQQLMDMGFRKEEAQTALITNNMNLEMAINELKSNNGMSRKDEMDMYQSNGPQSRMPPYMPKSGLSGDDFTDPARSDQVPHFNMTMQNTPFSNAQIPNQPFVANSASLPPSSLNSSTSSINSNVHQKLIQKLPVAPPGNNAGSRGQMPQSSEQVQQHIVAQLRMAVNSGIISPQLLNHTLPRNMLVLLQQLLQLQTARQNLIARLPQRQSSRQQMDQYNTMMNNINQNMIGLQKQLQQAQNVFFSSQKPPNMSQQPPTGIMSLPGGQQPGGALAENIDAISSELANASIGNQSRLATQWKPGPDTSTNSDSFNAGYSPGLLSATSAGSDVGDKMGNSNSTNYMNLIGGGLGITGDRTWSSVSSASSSQNWPSTSSESAIITGASVSSTTASGLSGLTDVIPEFIPGKPWQGLTKSSVEDDPHITPGSIQRSLSVNRVHDDSLNNLSGSKLDGGKSWSSSSSKNENSLGLGHLGSRPPPSFAPPKSYGAQPWQQGGNAVYSRQSSWAGRSGNSAFTQVGASNWNDTQGHVSNWIVLKNLTYMDSATTRALSQRHGDVINFYYIPENHAALIQYGNREVAANAQKALNNFTMGTSTLKAEFISDSEAHRATSQLPSQNFQQNSAPIASHWFHAPPTGFQHTGGNRSGEIWSQVSNPWSGSSLWGEASSAADQNCNPLLSNLGGILDA